MNVREELQVQTGKVINTTGYAGSDCRLTEQTASQTFSYINGIIH